MSLAVPRAPPRADERMSAQLPTITCSTCAVQLPLDQLGEHVCAPGQQQAGTHAAPARQRSRERSGTAVGSPAGGPGAAYSNPPHGGLGVGPPAQQQQQQQQQQQRPPLHPQHSHGPSLQLQMPDTRVGGQSGMAGVGRRAFAAAAWAATAVARPAPPSAHAGLPSATSPTGPHAPWSDEYQRPPTPPYAHFGRSSSPALEDAQNQSQPYFIASHGMREREADAERQRLRDREREQERERAAQQARERARWEQERAVREQRQREAAVEVEAAQRQQQRQQPERAPRPSVTAQASSSRPRSREATTTVGRRPSDAQSARTAVSSDRGAQRPAGPSRSITAPVPRGQRPSLDIPTAKLPTGPVSASATVPAPGGRLPFFEKYKKMVDGSAAAPSTGLTRSASGVSKPVLTPIPSPSVTDDEEVDSPIELGFSDDVAIRQFRARAEAGIDDEEDSALPWARTEDTAYGPVDEQPGRAAAKTQHAKADSSGGSVSTLSSSMAARMRLGEVAPLTPSTSADRLDQVAQAPQPPSPRQLPRGLTPQKPGESRSPDEPPSPFMDSDAAGPTTRDRDSFRSSMLGPGDSISLIAGFPGERDRRSRSDTLRQNAGGGGVGGGKRCQQCGDSLQGRRFIQRDGVLLCEEDWKELFLPKCRRCDKPIETAAVSSADGQLKGKWHRACFTCFECDSPFENDSFYVHADKPYCQRHYHELNGSICSSASCRRPIEGPCLLVGTERFHPTHFRCDHRDSAGVQVCDNDMADYYAVGKLRVCGAHRAEAIVLVNRMMGRSDSRGRAGGMSARAEKRRTRLIHA